MTASSHKFDMNTRRAIRAALAHEAYTSETLRIVDPQVSGYHWLAASHRDVFAISPDGWKTVIHGWFFGICLHEDALYLFENCGLRDRRSRLGRIVRVTLRKGKLADPQVIACGLHGNCHQIRVIDGLLHLVDTANQQILRYQLNGNPVDIKRPFPRASVKDTSGAYLHINSIAKVGERIGLMLHNGKAQPEKCSEVAWLDDGWNLEERYFIEGHQSHDIVEDEAGTLWHSASRSGEIISSDRRRHAISDSLMTRGISFTQSNIAVGLSTFGPRHMRGFLGGRVAILNKQFQPKTQFDLPGSPTDIVAL